MKLLKKKLNFVIKKNNRKFYNKIFKNMIIKIKV